MDTSKHIVQSRIGKGGFVRVLNIEYGAVLSCDRDCSALETSYLGSIKCSLDRVKKLVNFQTKALVVDYEVLLDNSASEEWNVYDSCFHVIDDEGHIHEGSAICNTMISPKKEGDTSFTLYPGTRANLRIFYDSFPPRGKVTSIIAEWCDRDKVRMFITPDAVPADNPEPIVLQPFTIPQEADDTRRRIEDLEKAVKELQKQIIELRTNQF